MRINTHYALKNSGYQESFESRKRGASKSDRESGMRVNEILAFLLRSKRAIKTAGTGNICVQVHHNCRVLTTDPRYRLLSPTLSSIILSAKTILLRTFFSDLRYTLLHVLDFDSTRKRMSVIVKSPRGMSTKQIKKPFFGKGDFLQMFFLGLSCD